MNATSQAASGGDPTAWLNVLSAGCKTAPQSAVEVDDRIPAQHFEQRLDVGRLDQPRSGLERVEPSDSRGIADRADVLDVDPVDLCDLVDEQIDQPRLGEGDDQLVDRASGAALEDLDADDVASHRTDPARDLAERAGTIGQPDAHRVVLHHHRTLRISMNALFTRASKRAAQCADPCARSTDCRASASRSRRKRSGRRRRESQLREGLAQVAHGLVDALLVLDQREPHEAVAAGTEPDAGRRRHVRLL